MAVSESGLHTRMDLERLRGDGYHAFLIGEHDFDGVFARVHDSGAGFWADPARSRPGEINRNDGGRGVYFEDPDGHLLEVLTRPYGSG